MALISNSPAVRRRAMRDLGGSANLGLAPEFTEEQAWGIIRDRGWGAICLPLKDRVGTRTVVVRIWFVYRRRDWAYLLGGRSLRETVRKLVVGVNPPRHLPAVARAALRDRGKAPLDPAAHAAWYAESAGA